MILYPVHDLARNLGSTIHYLKTYNGVQEWMPIQLLTSLIIVGKKKKQKYAECCVKQYLQETPSLHPCTMSAHVIDSHYIDTKTIEEIFFYTP